MNRILLLGDSIRMGYDKYVKLAFKDIAEVVYPEENCRSSVYLLRNLLIWREWLDSYDNIDIIHWNAGLWDDLHLLDGKPLISLEQYQDNIDRICIHLEKLFPKAKIIFATSTPVREEFFGGCKRFNKDTENYNKVACEIVKKHGGHINDLYSLMSDCPNSYHSDMTHYYTKEGTKIITNAVVNSIAEHLNVKASKLDYDKCYNQVDIFLGM